MLGTMCTALGMVLILCYVHNTFYMLHTLTAVHFARCTLC